MHVPEIIKKHTHVRTVYKHHYKSKPKHPEKSKHYKSSPSKHNYYERPQHEYYGHDRRDPAIRQDKWHSKFQKNQWFDHLVPAASHLHESTSESSGIRSTSSSLQKPEILSQWQHNFQVLNRKPFVSPTSSSSSSSSSHKQKHRKKPKARPTLPPPPQIPIYAASEESTDPTEQGSTNLEPLDFKFFQNDNGDQDYFFEEPINSRATGEKLHQLVPKEPKSLQQHRSTNQKNHEHYQHTFIPNPKKKTINPPNHSPEHRSPTNPDRPYQTNFKPPRLLKITEQDRTTKSTAFTDTRHSNNGKTANPAVKQHRTTNPFANKPDDGNSHVTLNWDAFAKDPPNSVQYPDYIHAVAAVLKSNPPPQSQKPRHQYQSNPSSFDNGGYEQTGYGLPRPTALAQVREILTAPPMPSQEEFLPLRAFQTPQPLKSNGQFAIDKQQPDKEANYDDVDDGEDVDVDYGGQQQHRGVADDDEVAPLSFDEVPYQTFTKRKNLLRNAHRD